MYLKVVKVEWFLYQFHREYYNVFILEVQYATNSVIIKVTDLDIINKLINC
jgi:hypothetical protein